MLLAADHDRHAFGAFQRAQRRREGESEARQAALASPEEIASALAELEDRLRGLRTTAALELDRRLALEITGAAREAVLRLREEFAAQG